MAMNQEPQKQGGKQDNQRKDQAQQSPGRDQSGNDSRTQGRQPTNRDDEQRRDQADGSDTRK